MQSWKEALEDREVVYFAFVALQNLQAQELADASEKRKSAGMNLCASLEIVHCQSIACSERRQALYCSSSSSSSVFSLTGTPTSCSHAGDAVSTSIPLSTLSGYVSSQRCCTVTAVKYSTSA